MAGAASWAGPARLQAPGPGASGEPLVAQVEVAPSADGNPAAADLDLAISDTTWSFEAPTLPDVPGDEPAEARPGLPPALQPFSHVVAPGETLSAIAERFGVDVDTLIGANRLDDPDLVPVGTALVVLPVLGVVHEVAEGDTVNLIAARYRATSREIVLANALENAELIRPGDKLIVPGARPDPRPKTAPAQPGPQARPVVASRLVFAWPAFGRITSYFGERGWTSPRGHAGLDIAAPTGASIAATEAGVVVVATRAGGAYGYLVIVDHGGGVTSVYGHLSRIDVEPGERVERGEQLGLVGSTGFSTGPHLHFEIRQNGALQDPLRLLP